MCASSAGPARSRRIAPVTQRRSPQIESLTKRISSREEQDIDQLYGLEPVFEPGSAASRGGELEQFVAFQCPWCGERLETRVDLTAGEREYIEDCEVCCRPIELGIELEEDGALHALRVQRLD
jgi:predicted RNA-binding Zn-ribbon protein involved in translation (DUF1610 family)